MPFLKKNFFRVAGAIVFFLALTVIAISLYLFSNPGVEYDEKSVEQFAVEQCKQEAIDLGYTASVDPRSKYLVLKNPGIEDWYQEIAKSSVIIERCKGFTLREYCIGQSCRPVGEKEPISGITFAFKPAKKIIIN